MSTIKVDRIEPQDGLQTNAMGGIVQVVRVVYTGQATTTSTSYVSTGLQASITPRSASNKIMVSFEHSMYRVPNNLTAFHGIRIKRGTNVIYTPVTNSVGPYDFGVYSANTVHGRSRVEYLDSPSTTSSITYSTEMALYGDGTLYSNYQDTSTAVTPQSFMTLMEITA
jgi:hypothetical protein